MTQSEQRAQLGLLRPGHYACEQEGELLVFRKEAEATFEYQVIGTDDILSAQELLTNGRGEFAPISNIREIT